jgi:hypothetical protein
MITGMPRIAIVVRDFSKAVNTFRDRYGMPVIDLSESSVESLGAKLAMCVPNGGSNIEIMSPADPLAPLSQSLQRCIDSRGEGFFALMLEAPDPDAEAEDLLDRGLNVLPLMAGAAGRDVHPNSTHGVLVRVYPVNSFQGQDYVTSNSSQTPALSGIQRVIIAVHDLDHAVEVYGNMFAMDISDPVEDATRGIRSAICTPATGGLIELVSVMDAKQPFAKSIDDFLRDNREGMYAIALQSVDVQASAKVLAEQGLKVSASADSPDILEVDRSSNFGALVRIEAG